MKKIIVAFDGLKYSLSSEQYAIDIAAECKAHLVGIFLNDFTYHSYKSYKLVGEEGIEAQLNEEEERDLRTREKAAEKFKIACTAAGVKYSIREDRSIAIQEILHESVYADLLIIDRSETVTRYEEKSPTRFIHDLLPEVQCPVLVVPDKFIPIDSLTLLYDGQPASVCAIRSFSNTLPALKRLPTEVVTVNQSWPDGHLIKDFVKHHFASATHTLLHGDPEKVIVDHLNKKGVSSLVVLGAYNRGFLSRMLRQSMADVLMKEVGAPLFIAHSK